MSAVPTPELAEEAGLRYVTDQIPGITRKKTRGGYDYFHPNGKPVEDQATILRIAKLAIPPAYKHVWICPMANGHLQATGRDARGRKQYRYHEKWLELGGQNKFTHIQAFGSALPKIRERVDQDLCKQGLPKEKVLATIVWFLENSLIRVGSEEYAKENKSYGLTTMRMRHCKVEGQVIQFRFVGKRGIKHDVQVADRRLARIVKKLQEIPGQELFNYVDEEGSVKSVTSEDVNSYLKEISGEEFTAKDFRTWTATVMTLAALSGCCEFTKIREKKSAISQTMKVVSEQLGNTPAICRKSYVHPGLLEAYSDGSLKKFLESRKRKNVEEHAEEVTLEFLSKLP